MIKSFLEISSPRASFQALIFRYINQFFLRFDTFRLTCSINEVEMYGKSANRLINISMNLLVMDDMVTNGSRDQVQREIAFSLGFHRNRDTCRHRANFHGDWSIIWSPSAPPPINSDGPRKEIGKETVAAVTCHDRQVAVVLSTCVALSASPVRWWNLTRSISDMPTSFISFLSILWLDFIINFVESDRVQIYSHRNLDHSKTRCPHNGVIYFFCDEELWRLIQWSYPK